MDEILKPSVIASFTALCISLITLYQFFKNQRFQQKQFDKNLNRTLTNKLYDLRIENYPLAYEITDIIYKHKGGNYDYQELKTVLENLIVWKKGIVNLIISVECRDSFYDLRDVLMKNPANNQEYSKEQIDKIFQANKFFRKQLRRDLGFMYREERLRRK
ncbi:hypothetical protein SAMN06265371_10613 [Lutibacter agarilyticus]|uniref:DUF4760 domain-containing protein n=1 Tax=Lutibacter agarilyticus TaxID=1109740 RepID=A0A238XHQ6_9FLAO|nr:hypothetical protein [Lutibacter agarilyticus]SNR57874.1 hypothetical protein SAMN06265371_10613 [Lutibacter agarilyticus]